MLFSRLNEELGACSLLSLLKHNKPTSGRTPFQNTNGRISSLLFLLNCYTNISDLASQFFDYQQTNKTYESQAFLAACNTHKHGNILQRLLCFDLNTSVQKSQATLNYEKANRTLLLCSPTVISPRYFPNVVCLYLIF